MSFVGLSTIYPMCNATFSQLIHQWDNYEVHSKSKTVFGYLLSKQWYYESIF